MYRGPLTQSPPCFYGSPEGPVTLLAAHLGGQGEGCSVGCNVATSPPDATKSYKVDMQTGVFCLNNRNYLIEVKLRSGFL